MIPRPPLIARQSAHPRGLLGRIVARVMRTETYPDNELALRALQPGLRDHVLEVGFGHGRTLARLAELVPEGHVRGVDHSELMLRVARRHNRDAVAAGRMELRVGDSADLPWSASTLDAALAVHTLYFWQPLTPHLEELRRVLRPGGRLILAYRPAEDRRAVRGFPAEIYRFRHGHRIRAALEEAGFRYIRIEARTAGARTLELASASTRL